MGFFSNFQASDAIDIANLFIKPNSPNPIAPPTYLIQGSGVGQNAGQASSGLSSNNSNQSSNNMLLIVGGIVATIIVATLGFLFTRKSSRR